MVCTNKINNKNQSDSKQDFEPEEKHIKYHHNIKRLPPWALLVIIHQHFLKQQYTSNGLGICTSPNITPTNTLPKCIVIYIKQKKYKLITKKFIFKKQVWEVKIPFKT